MEIIVKDFEAVNILGSFYLSILCYFFISLFCAYQCIIVNKLSLGTKRRKISIVVMLIMIVFLIGKVSISV